MKILVIVIVLALLTAACWKFNVIGGTTVIAQTADPAVKTTALAHVVNDIDGKDFDLATLKGKVVLIVNVASRCGFTPQYKGLEALYVKYKDRGLVIVGFPANDFGSQEPGTDAEIKQFCSSKYDVTFPMMSKIVVTGDNKHPVYKALTEGTGKFSGEIGWNFTKFLIARDGETILARFASKTAPDDEQVTKAVEDALGK